MPQFLGAAGEARCLVAETSPIPEDVDARAAVIERATSTCRSRTTRLMSGGIMKGGKGFSEDWQRQGQGMIMLVERDIVALLKQLPPSETPTKDRIRVLAQSADGSLSDTLGDNLNLKPPGLLYGAVLKQDSDNDSENNAQNR